MLALLLEVFLDFVTSRDPWDLGPRAGELTRQAQPKEEPVALSPRRFEAYTDCPKCGTRDFHFLRAPKPAPSDRQLRLGPILPIDGHAATLPMDESGFETVRICTNCHNEWGML